MSWDYEMVLGLGSNHENSHAYLLNALRHLKSIPELRLTAVSSIYRSEAMLPPQGSHDDVRDRPQDRPQDWNAPFLNAAAKVELSGAFSAEKWLSRFKDLERRMGRKQTARWAPREIDIDILSCGQSVVALDHLQIPHPGLLNRPFAVHPLLDVDPQWRHPESGTVPARWVGPIPFDTRKTELTFSEWVAIINVTPDSFSDGGLCVNEVGFFNHAETCIQEGATVLDVGTESTRPGASPIDSKQEIARLTPALHAWVALKKVHPAIKLSVDSRHAETVAWALGITDLDFINDVSGFEKQDMLDAVRSATCRLIFMHSLAIPADPRITLPADQDPVDLLLSWARQKIEAFEREGICRDRLVFDPGIGFGKTPAQSREILSRIHEFHGLGIPVLVGHSRKSFMKRREGESPWERDGETARISAELVKKGVEYVRVHNVKVQQQAVHERGIF